MSQTVDERVVEMRFDNKQFEQGAKETMTTLEKLKASLNMDASAKSFQTLDKAANSVNLSGIAAGIEALQNRFSTMGIVGMRVIENITDSLMNLASGAMGYVSDAIVSGGLKRAQNIENAHFQLQALLKDEEAVQAVMADAMTSVDGTAYAYDEAAKAASQFAASGMKAGDEMVSALRGITGVAAMTNSEYEGISRIFTTVAGNGRLMGDQLLQLSSRGLNAAATIADYFKEVKGFVDVTESDIRKLVSDGQISFQDFAAAMDWAFGESAFRANETFTGALSNMRSALARIGAEFFSPLIEQNSDLILLINTVRERINDIKKGLTFDEQRSAISGLTKLTGQTTESFEELFSVIKDQGHLSTEQMLELGATGVNVAGKLTDYINGVTNGTIRSTYATKMAIDEMTGGFEITQDKLRQLVEDGKIDLAIFQSAMEAAYGDQTALSKQFTTSVLDMAKSVSAFLKTIDLSKPLSVVYYGIESIKNVFKGLYSFLKPIGKAFADVFLSFDMDSVIDLASKIEDLTSKMRLSEKQSENLHDTFQGIFSVVKLLMDAVLGLFGVMLPVTKPMDSLLDVILALTGAMGRGLSEFTAWINRSPLLGRIYSTIASGVQKATSAIADFISNFDEVVDYIYNLPFVQRVIEAIGSVLDRLYERGKAALPILIDRLKEFASTIANLIPKKAKDGVQAFTEQIEELQSLNFTSISDVFGHLREKLKAFVNIFKSNEGISTFIANAKEYFGNFREAFSFDTVFENIEKFKKLVGGFADWLQGRVGPVFEDFSIGGALAAAGGFGILYAITKATEAIGKVTNTLNAIPSLLGAVKGVLVDYQANLKADTMMKIAKAITLLAVAITVLSFADTERVYQAVVAIGIVGAVLTLAVAQLMKGVAGAQGVGATIYTVGNTLAKGLNNLTKAIKWKAIGAAVRDIGLAIAMIVGTLLVLAYAYSKDGSSVEKAAMVIAEISTVIVGLIVVLSLLGKFLSDGMSAVKTVSEGVLMLAASLLIVVVALQKLFALEFPADFDQKMDLITKIFLGLGALTIIIGLASRIAMNKEASQSASIADSILSMAGALYICVLAIQKLFAIEMPPDYENKLFILAGLFAGLSLIIISIGLASRLAKGSLKATGSLLAMCLLMATMVGSLIILSFFPGEKLLSGAIALGVTLMTLGVALAGAGKISEGTTWKTVLAMAIEVGAITAALGVLSMISMDKLIKAAVALGSVLAILALDFFTISKITEDTAFVSVIAMAANIAIIAVALSVLAGYDWKALLSAGSALGIVLLSVAGAFAIISKSDVDVMSIASFLSGTFGVIMVAVALSGIATYPWEQLIGAGAAISAVLLSMGVAFALMSATRPSLVAIGEFLAGLIGVVVIGEVLKSFANQPWDGMLEIAKSISMILIGMAIAMAVASLAGKLGGKAVAIGIAALDGFIASLALILTGLGALSDQFGDLFAKGGEVFMNLGSYIGGFISNIASAFGSSDTKEEQGESYLASLGNSLSDFANNSTDFFDIVSKIDNSLVTGAKNLAEAILLITGTEFVTGLASLFGFGPDLDEMKTTFSKFGAGVNAFYEEVKNIDPTVVEAASTCALALAELYDNLPKQDGWWQKIVGEQMTLADFAYELIPFGAAMVLYSKTVAGNIDQDAVKASIAAAEVLLEFSEKLPNMGGLMGLIFGEKKSLSDYAYELIPFGIAMVTYCATVAGKIDQEAVEASIAAAEVLFAFSEKLPNMGGLVGIIFGDQKTLSEFAEELVPFADAMVQYADTVSGLDTDVVTNTSNAAEALVELGNKLEGNSGLLSIFSRNTNLDDFGKQLKKFGAGLSSYYESVKDIETLTLFEVIAAVESLIALANGTAELDTTGMIIFAQSLAAMGAMGIDAFIQAFGDSVERTTEAVDGWLVSVVTNLEPDKETLVNVGYTLGTQVPYEFKKGVDVVTPIAVNTVGSLCSQISARLREGLPSIFFNVNGENAVKWLANGIISANHLAVEAAQNVSQNVKDSFEGNITRNGMVPIGENAAEGIAEGINNKIGVIRDSAVSAARMAVETAKTHLKIQSPSKVFMEIGEYVSLGLAKGIENEVRSVEDASEFAAESSIESMNYIIQAIARAIDTNEDFQPTIRPVLDLSNITEGANQINSLFGDRVAISSYENAIGASSGFSRNYRDQLAMDEVAKQLTEKLDGLLDVEDGFGKTENHNIFYVQSTDPKQAAEEIDYIMQRKVERGRAAWAK